VSEAEARLRTLMLASLGGDAAAYRELLRELAGRLRVYYARRLGPAVPDAEDLVQETLIAVHSRRASYDRSQPFTAWVYAMARYKLIDHLRKARIRTAIPIDACEELFAADEQAQASAAADVDRLLSDLPAAQRDAIRLTHLEGLSIDEAAARTGRSASATKVGIHRGLKNIMSRLKNGEPNAND
jgi:RNA polymerase sigma-70 factor (ECF subfamily)